MRVASLWTRAGGREEAWGAACQRQKGWAPGSGPVVSPNLGSTLSCLVLLCSVDGVWAQLTGSLGVGHSVICGTVRANGRVRLVPWRWPHVDSASQTEDAATSWVQVAVLDGEGWGGPQSPQSCAWPCDSF